MNSPDLSGRLAELARDLRSQSTAQATLDQVVASVVELIGPCEAASITLVDKRGGVRTTAATDELALFSDQLQEELKDGPFVEAAWSNAVVSVTDCKDEERWPAWATRACDDLGIRSVLCVRLFTHESDLGTLNLFASEPHLFGDDVEQEAVAFAAHAAVALAGAERIDQLGDAIGSRTVIGQATGLTMHRFGLTDGQAFEALRRLSNDQNRKLSAIAQEMVEEWNSTGREQRDGR